MATAVESAKEQDLRPLAEECVRELSLDPSQAATIASHLEDAWFFGIRLGHAVMLETKQGRTDPEPTVLEMREELQDLMESLADALDVTVGATVAAWSFLGRAWVTGVKFWEVEIAARMIESRSGGFEEAIRPFEE